MKKLKELRMNKKLSQKNVAELLNVTSQAYGKYENGINEPNTNSLNILANFYNVSVDYLMGREDDQQMFDNARIEIKSLPKTEIQKLFDSMNELQQIEIVSYARGMLARGASSADVHSTYSSKAHSYLA